MELEIITNFDNILDYNPSSSNERNPTCTGHVQSSCGCFEDPQHDTLELPISMSWGSCGIALKYRIEGKEDRRQLAPSTCEMVYI